MKSENEIREIYSCMLRDYFTKFVDEKSAKVPLNCRFNYRHGLDVRKTILVDGVESPNPNYNRISANTDQSIGLCGLTLDKDIRICDETLDIATCPKFALRYTRDSILPIFWEYSKKEHPDLVILKEILSADANQISLWMMIRRFFSFPKSLPIAETTAAMAILNQLDKVDK